MDAVPTPPSPPHIAVRPATPRHGGLTIVALSGLAPRERVAVEAVASESGDVVDHLVRADAAGRIDTAVTLPDRANGAQFWTFAATSVGRDHGAATAPILVLPSR